MSRLDSNIRRLEAQRACLAAAAGMVAELDGPVVELGLGNGRTYDHLRELLPDREIFVFDRQMKAHPSSMPDDDHMILGELCDTLPGALSRIGAPGALLHCDVGSGRRLIDTPLFALVAETLPQILAPGAIVLLADFPIDRPGFREIEVPDGIEPGRYFMYRMAGP